jgi:crossover junction endodeoxyribonuclease RuvC
MKRKRNAGLFQEEEKTDHQPRPKPASSPLPESHLFIGIDPGQTGALAVINKNLEIHHITDWSSEILIAEALRKIKKNAVGKGIILNAALEYAHAMPDQGVTSMFRFGTNYGIWQGILAAFAIPYVIVTPQKWQKGVIKKAETKAPAISAAARLFPSAELWGPRGGKKDGRADALLIAYWCRRNFING